MHTESSPTLNFRYSKSAYLVSLFGTALVLLWIGIFKFTPTEALAIKPLIEHHPRTLWMYRVFSIQNVSNIIGTFEIIVSILILLTLKFPRLRLYAGIGTCMIFTVTLSFLFTTPGLLKIVDGVPIADGFILKDIVFLGFGISLLPFSYK